MIQREINYLSRFKHYRRALALVVAAVVVLVWFGWIANIVGLETFLPGFPPMSPLAALAALLLAVIAFEPPRIPRSLLTAMAVGVGIGSTMLLAIGLVTSQSLPFVLKLFADGPNMVQNNFAPLTPLCLLGLSIAAFLQNKNRAYRVRETIIIGTFFLMYLIFIGHVTHAEYVKSFAFFAHVSIPAELTIFFISLGLLFREGDRGFMSLLLSRTEGGSFARELLLAVVLFPAVTTQLALIGVSTGWYDRSLGTAMNVAINVVIFEYFVWKIGQRLRLSEEARLIAEQQAEQRQQELATFQQATDASTEGVVMTDTAGNIVYVNAAWEMLTGWKLAEVQGKNPRLLQSGKTNPALYKKMWKALIAGKSFRSDELINKRKDGSEYEAEIHVYPIQRTGKGTMYVGLAQDVTKRKSYEKYLADLTTRFRLATSNAKIGVWELDVIGQSVQWDDQMLALFNIRRKDFNGSSTAWEERLHPEDRARAVDEIAAALYKGTPLDTTYRIVWPNKEVHWIRAFGSVERDEKGKPVKIIGVNWDVTREKEIDQAKTEFVSLASHQLRTPLTSIKWYSEMLMNGDAGKLTAPQKTFVQEVFEGSQRMALLVNALLNVARIEAGTFSVAPEMVSIQDTIATVLKENGPTIQVQQQKIKQQIDTKAPPVSVDRQLMYIVVQNLITNAIKYTPAKGAISVGYERRGRSLIFTVADTGYGIPKASQKNIFQKLYRADNVRSKVTDGTGLGLYIVKSILDHTGGSIGFTSEENHGTTFTVTLPVGGMQARTGTKSLNP